MFEARVKMPGGSVRIQIKDRVLPEINLPIAIPNRSDEGGWIPALRHSELPINAGKLGLGWSEDIGETTIDLDSRWYNAGWRALDKSPVESRSLFKEGSLNARGSVELWVDIFDAKEVDKRPRLYRPIPVAPPVTRKYFLRVVIFKVADVMLPYKLANYDPNKLAALKVEARLGNRVVDQRQTDTCKYVGDGVGPFNWRMQWELNLPSVEVKPRLKLQVFDGTTLCGVGDVKLRTMFDDMIATPDDHQEQAVRHAVPPQPPRGGGARADCARVPARGRGCHEEVQARQAGVELTWSAHRLRAARAVPTSGLLPLQPRALLLLHDRVNAAKHCVAGGVRAAALPLHPVCHADGRLHAVAVVLGRWHVRAGRLHPRHARAGRADSTVDARSRRGGVRAGAVLAYCAANAVAAGGGCSVGRSGAAAWAAAKLDLRSSCRRGAVGRLSLLLWYLCALHAASSFYSFYSFVWCCNVYLLRRPVSSTACALHHCRPPAYPLPNPGPTVPPLRQCSGDTVGATQREGQGKQPTAASLSHKSRRVEASTHPPPPRPYTHGAGRA
eukprot:TRINITY_DN1368_c0_g1_i6.p1 TRINITY_DN1368_c0_g1~~TRINITY_DN1368_c0_g1_i6.p1  ORF type:complete len:556 (+),score=74.14 TRINITY_DN1368_c0_g1_i6:814-2481(+)